MTTWGQCLMWTRSQLGSESIGECCPALWFIVVQYHPYIADKLIIVVLSRMVLNGSMKVPMLSQGMHKRHWLEGRENKSEQISRFCAERRVVQNLHLWLYQLLHQPTRKHSSLMRSSRREELRNLMCVPGLNKHPSACACHLCSSWIALAFVPQVPVQIQCHFAS